VWTVKGFSPAHVTGFFEVGKQHIDPYRKGSRGAGLNLELGVTATVRLIEEGDGFVARANGEVVEAPTLKMALMGVLGEDYPARVEVDLESVLPAGQGFGLSGAGALASTVALSGLFGFPARRAMWEAHKAETLNQTGLGDVPAQYLGGAEIRVTPGPMPMGVTKRFAGLQARRSQVVCCVVGGPLSTKAVLSDPERMQRVNEAGGRFVEELEAKPDLENYARLSRRFAEKVGLMSSGLEAALEAADAFGWATQTMLGDCLHLIIDPKDKNAGDPEEAARVLGDHGDVWVTKIAARGAHVVDAS
jgi:pantoate kinase